MEQAGAKLGARHGIPEIVVGGLILAAVTSLPNAVAAVYLARRDRGAATLSTAMNSNALNVTVGLLLPATVVGLATSSGPATLAAAWYLGVTALALVSAYLAHGLRRAHGALILCAYLSFSGMVLSIAYASPFGLVLSIAAPVAAAIPIAAWLLRSSKRGTPPPGRIRPEQARVETMAAITMHPRIDPDDREPTTNGTQPGLALRSPQPGQSLLTGWSISRVWYLALVLTSSIAAADAILGHHVILIGLLIAGPCCALLTGRWARTAIVGGWAVALAVLLGIPDEIWGTSTHLVFLAAVVIVALVSTSSAAVVEKRS
jgi:hypothetical protein